MSKIFMSYSHRDEELRDELETHLSMLKRKGLISTWHDRKISAGDNFENKIDENLEDSDIVLLLISPYFLESDYCFNTEMKRAFARHESGEARVIPIILEHCDWKIAQFSKLQALPKNGRPVTDYPNQHKAFLEISQGIRKVIENTSNEILEQDSAKATSREHATSSVEKKDPQRSSNLRVKKTFTDKEKDDFLIKSYEYIYKFFKNSLDELRNRSDFIDFNLERVDSQTFTAKIYKKEKKVSECKIWRGTSLGSSQAINYSNTISNRNNFSTMFTVNDDGYTQYLESSGVNAYAFYNFEGKKDLSKKGASEQMWAMLIQPLQQ